MSKPKVGVILTWVGPWRPWIELTLHSFSGNVGFDLHILSPQPPPMALARNIRHHPFSVADFSQRIGHLLGTEFTLKRPYKLCDFRPTFGHLFADILKDYEFWGWCDEDIVWGDLARSFPESVLGSYDIITSCRCSITGQFTLIRQSEETSALYTRIPGWREKLLHQATNYFLEEGPLNDVALAMEAKEQLRVLRRQIQTHDVNSAEWNDWADRLEVAASGHPHGEFKHGPAFWQNGRIFNEASGDEFAFFHFKSWKCDWALPRIPLPPPNLDVWNIDQRGIQFGATGEITASDRRYLEDYERACRRASERQQWGKRLNQFQKFYHRVGHAIRRRLIRP